MKTSLAKYLQPGLLILALTACARRDFYPDYFNPGLSRFTDYGYNIASEYINDSPYVNPFSVLSGNYLPQVQKISTNSTFDTLSFYWPIIPNDTNLVLNPRYINIVLLLPVSKSFGERDFLNLNDQRFASDSNTISLQLVSPSDTGYSILSGTGNIYFVKVALDISGSTDKIEFSGLFDGNIGDSILITKGRFDFKIPVSNFVF